METLEHDSNCQSISQPFTFYENYMTSFSDFCREEVPVREKGFMYDFEDSSNTTNSRFSQSSNGKEGDGENANEREHGNNFLASAHIFYDSNVQAGPSPHSRFATLETATNRTETDYPVRDCFLSETLPNRLEERLESTGHFSAALISESLGVLNDCSSLGTEPIHQDLPIETPTTSEDTKSDQSVASVKPVMTTSLITMENSNNAVDSARLFADKRDPSEVTHHVFKLPNNELSFNGTLKHLQKLKPLVDPTMVFCLDAKREFVSVSKQPERPSNNYKYDIMTASSPCMLEKSIKSEISSSTSSSNYPTDNETSEMGASDYTNDMVESTNSKNANTNSHTDSSATGMDSNRSGESLDNSYHSGVESPNMFSEEEEEFEQEEESEKWDLSAVVEKQEFTDKLLVKKMERTLRGVVPPPSVTNFYMDVPEMLKRYKEFLPIFNREEGAVLNPEASNSVTPPRKISNGSPQVLGEKTELGENTEPDSPELQSTRSLLSKSVSFCFGENKSSTTQSILSQDSSRHSIMFNKRTSSVMEDLNCSSDGLKVYSEKCEKIKLLSISGTEEDAKNMDWPEVLGCRYFDVHYNITGWSDRAESLGMRCAERYVAAETASSVTVYSGSLHSPTSAQKRKAIRAKQALCAGRASPGGARRLSHLARRRQMFCSAATLADSTHNSNKMVLIDKKKLTNLPNNRKSPRVKQIGVRKTPGKKTPGKKTPAKKTPGRKTPGGSSSKKRAVRRLLIDSDTVTRSQPTRETSKRALFMSPENDKVQQSSSTSSSTSIQSLSRCHSARAVKSKRALFGSPAKNCLSNSFGESSSGKRKREEVLLDPNVAPRNKMQKSLSFGGDNIGQSQPTLTRRATENFSSRNGELNELHKKKLLWAVAEALRAHGCGMGHAAFRARAHALARLTTRLLALPQHARARQLASTSDTMLRLARQYVFSIIRGRSVEELVLEEQMRLSNLAGNTNKLQGYVSVNAYEQFKSRNLQNSQSSSSFSSKFSENISSDTKVNTVEPLRSFNKNVLQDKLVNIDVTSRSASNSAIEGLATVRSELFESNSMPAFRDAKMRARRQISFDNIDEPPKR